MATAEKNKRLSFIYPPWFGKIQKTNVPCVTVLRCSGSVMTSPRPTSDTLSGFLDSPQRLEPPCMLGMLRMAIPSKATLLRSKRFPQHCWQRTRLNIKTELCFGENTKWHFFQLTSITRLSLSFLQEAEMVSEVANSKYHSLFFILKSREQHTIFKLFSLA